MSDVLVFQDGTAITNEKIRGEILAKEVVVSYSCYLRFIVGKEFVYGSKADIVRKICCVFHDA